MSLALLWLTLAHPSSFEAPAGLDDQYKPAITAFGAAHKPEAGQAFRQIPRTALSRDHKHAKAPEDRRWISELAGKVLAAEVAAIIFFLRLGARVQWPRSARC